MLQENYHMTSGAVLCSQLTCSSSFISILCPQVAGSRVAIGDGVLIQSQRILFAASLAWYKHMFLKKYSFYLLATFQSSQY